MADAAQTLARSFPTIAAALGFPAPHRDRMRKSLAVEAIASDHRLHANVVKDDAAQRLARLFPPRAKAVRVTPLPDFVMPPNGTPKTRARSDAMSESLRGVEHSGLESFEHGAYVAVRLVRNITNRRFLSCASGPLTPPSSPLPTGHQQQHHHKQAGCSATMSSKCGEHEYFRLHKHADGTCSLQHAGGAFLSPVNGHDGSRWTCRDHCTQWERLHFTPVYHRSDGLVAGWRVHAVVEGERRFLGVPVRCGMPGVVPCVCRSENVPDCLDSACGPPALVWEVLLTQVPVLSAAGASLSDDFGWSVFDARAMPPGDVRRGLVLRVLRALREVGAFYLASHGLAHDLFHACQLALGGLPYVDDSVHGSDVSRKRNHLLFEAKGLQTNHGISADVLRVDPSAHRALIREHFDAAEALSNGLLHAMAAAQAFGGGKAASVAARYRSVWRDKWRYAALRVLSYYPGPQADADGATIVSTSRHTDATWLTILTNDQVDGLHIHSATLGDLPVSPPLAGALLINTGHVMAKASAGFYSPVCHWVERTPASEAQTRVSMPFFYDRMDDRDGPGFWAGHTNLC